MIYWYLNFKMVCDGRDEEGWIFLVAGFGLMGFFIHFLLHSTTSDNLNIKFFAIYLRYFSDWQISSVS